MRDGLALAECGVRSAVVHLAPSVHDEGRIKPWFVGRPVNIVQETGVAGYLGDGSSRWAAVHRLDAAHLFRLALESAPADSVLDSVAEEGVSQRSIAEPIAERLDVAVREIPSDEADQHFGWLGRFVGIDSPASNALTREILGWEPTHPTLLEDLRDGYYFQPLHW
jgi:nucleoside-diphosphate-sugar epimerase